MKILICVPVIPYPVADGLRMRIFNLAGQLAKKHDVHMFCLSRMAASREQEEAFADARIGLTVAVKPFLTPEAKFNAYMKRLVQGVPPEMILPWDNIIFSELAEVQRGRDFDVALGEHLIMGQFLKACDCPKIIDEHNIAGELSRSQARAAKVPGRWWELLAAAWIGRYEKKLLRRAQNAITATVADARKVEKLAPRINVSVVENGVSCGYYSQIYAEAGEPQDALLFVGLMSYPANADGVVWFLKEILPIIGHQYPETVFTIVGKEPPRSVRVYDNGTTVRVLGNIEDLRPLYHGSSVMVVPLDAGSGSRVKILEAFAAGTPVVSTSKGAEGLEIEDGRHLLIADTPQDFAAAVGRLREDPRLYSKLRKNARALVEEKYDWAVLGAKFETAVAVAAGTGFR